MYCAFCADQKKLKVLQSLTACMLQPIVKFYNILHYITYRPLVYGRVN